MAVAKLGRLTLDQHIGVRIPGGQPNPFSSFRSTRPLVIPLRSIYLTDRREHLRAPEPAIRITDDIPEASAVK